MVISWWHSIAYTMNRAAIGNVVLNILSMLSRQAVSWPATRGVELATGQPTTATVNCSCCMYQAVSKEYHLDITRNRCVLASFVFDPVSVGALVINRVMADHHTLMTDRLVACGCGPSHLGL